MEVAIDVNADLIQAHGNRVDAGQNCPIYYAMRKAGIPVKAVWVDDFMLEGDDESWKFAPEAVKWQLDMIGLLMRYEVKDESLAEYSDFATAALHEVGPLWFTVLLPIRELVPA